MFQRTRPTPGRYLAIAAVLCVFLFQAATARGVREPAPGILLVASERMGDPRFNRSVVLLIEHDHSGTWGVIINKPTQIDVSELVPAIEPGGGVPVYFGGPVRVEHLRFLYRDDDADSDRAGLPGVVWSESGEELKERLAGNPSRLRVYAGYAGWAPGQLTLEIAHGGWRMIEGRPGNVFSDDPDRLWQRLNSALDGVEI
ncbi:MAG: YqgE/AlgH family protein [Gammaproteobacteria bacterium]|nr:YqgE/AlgH family protein [Gammaproteobacteria bacterium]